MDNVLSRSNSRTELSDASSNIFHVTKVDETGAALWSGQLSISRTEMILYRKNLDPTRWPLKCLRRYGYDFDFFTFEMGRRCDTGEGIYAFQCRSPETLYRTLESYIQNSTLEDVLLPNSNSMISRDIQSSPMSTLSNQNSTTNNMIGSYILPNSRSSNSNTIRNTTTTDDLRRSYDASDSNYLEPIANRTMPHFHTLSDGTIAVESPLSPGSPNSLNNILEVTTLNPLPNTGLLNNNGVSNVYLEFDIRNNKKLSLDIPPQEYAPTVTQQTFW